MDGIFELFDKICFGGHSHVPGVWTTRGEYLDPEELCGIYILDGSKVYVNVGSVGKAFDDEGNLLEQAFVRRTDRFLNELIWMSKTLRYGRENISST